MIGLLFCACSVRCYRSLFVGVDCCMVFVKIVLFCVVLFGVVVCCCVL